MPGALWKLHVSVEVLIGVLELPVTETKETSFHVMEAEPAPLRHGDLADQRYFGSGGGLVLGFEGVEELLELGFAFPFQDQGAGGESVLDGVETDGGASFGGGRAGAFLRVAAVGGDLFFSGHGGSVIMVAGRR